ncbi:hypothetical protein C8F04DRAFT_1065578 [Mycena alexandri]|uniref:Uncharacterized protein n=1 Tax=Mycena alexandri TaxID=1745969 RepID=A0AAD6TFJ5_9AGAR|nr:hypothetical protein C8F04DRAFT_1065578 [Mycena alexandri]
MDTLAPDADCYPVPVHATSFARGEPLPAFPPKPSPPRDTPFPSYFSVHHPSVRQLVADLDILVPWDSPYLPHRIPCSESAFALTALALFDHHTDHLHPVFWAPERREHTAATVQRVLESGQNLIIPMPWTSAERALSTLAAREQARASPPAVKRIVGAKSVESPQRLPRLTRAAAARQLQAQEQQQQNDAEASTSALASPSAEKNSARRQNLSLEAPVPQRASARQQKQKERVEAVIPPAVVATVARPNHTRARSSSQESSETLVASSSSSSPTMSRAVSVSSADTAVDVVSVSPAKGKGRLITGAPSEPVDAPMSAELEKMAGTRMVTRSRTQKEPEAKPTPRKAPYPTTKTAQVAAGRKAPTGKRKTAKAR